MNGEHVGTWSWTANVQEFSYEPSWLQSEAARPISLSMPLRPAAQSYKGVQVEAFFEGLLPDNRLIRERLQRRFTNANDPRV